MSKICIIACNVLAKDIEQVAAQLGLSPGFEFLPGGLHERPDELRRRLQAAIDRHCASGSWDRLVIGYGACGRGTVGIQAREIPLSIPRVHDCISLFLGGDHLYQEQFRRYPGTFYITDGWLAGKGNPEKCGRAYAYMGDTKIYFEELADQYGAEHARATFKFLNSWRTNYQRAVYIDTGARHGSDRARCHAEAMAAENNWVFESIKGDHRLLRLLLTVGKSTAEILTVPPGQMTYFNAIDRGLSCRPPAGIGTHQPDPPERCEFINASTGDGRPLLTGLGIDAGGTYTDAVVFDFKTETVRCKCKALTTRWDFSVGIRQALAGLDQQALKQVQLVSISTTLATNALIENDGQKVGLLLMAPPGLSKYAPIGYSPREFLSARLDITGKELAPLDEDQVRRIARRMIEQEQVEAFAVSGYAGSINPDHELRTKRILQQETGKFVSCGHELSRLLNFKTRAETAVHNARIVPRLNRLMEGIGDVLKQYGITAPVMVVRGDGNLMHQGLARERPVDTILSGPAASVAGVRFLTRSETAIVVDMGGTTTDIAALKNGRARLCEQGARVGAACTHVKALKIHTTGLGGDSLITFHQNQWHIGPRRVAPMAWLGSRAQGLEKALAHLRDRKQFFKNSSKPMQMVALNEQPTSLALTDMEQRILALVAQRPRSLDELSQRTGILSMASLPLQRLEANHSLQRCGLTPTDLLHAAGRFNAWNAEASRQLLTLSAEIAGVAADELISRLMHDIVRRMAMEILAQRLETFRADGTLDNCATCRKLFASILDGNHLELNVGISLNHPLVGVGAPVKHFLPQVAELLGSRAVFPPEHDVANAVGAITSVVRVEHELTIKPDNSGHFYIQGLAGNQRFKNIAKAEGFARQSLLNEVREMARKAGTHGTSATISVQDEVGESSLGDAVFLGRKLVACIEGRPDRGG